MIEIRNLKDGDADQILRLVEECGPYVAPYNVYAYWILENYYSSTCIVAEEDNRVIGYLSGMPSLDKCAVFIWQICVHSDYRGKGIANQLLDYLMVKAKELQFDKIQLTITQSNNASQNLFLRYTKKNGFKLIEKNRCTFNDSVELIYEFGIK